MPDANGRFVGQGWSRAREDAWTRVFGPAVAHDDDPEESAVALAAEMQRCCGDLGSGRPCAGCPDVPTPPSDEVGRER